MDTDAMADRYEANLREWADLTRRQDRGSRRKANRRVDDAHLLQRQLRETSAGRQAIERLAGDPDRLVRGWAATHCLQWNPAFGRAVLEEIRDSGGTDGPDWDIAGFDAEWTLKVFEKGELNLD